MTQITPGRQPLPSLVLLISLVALLPQAALAEEARTPDATVELTNWSVGILVGYRWGSGVLEYQGRKYRFRVRGFSALDLGASNADISGQVYNLKTLGDFGGTYTMFTAGGPWGENQLENGKGATVRWSSDVAGIEAKLGFDWIGFTLQE